MSEHAQAAPAILGSSLLSAAKEHEKQNHVAAISGSATIDEKPLEGGFRYGEITSIAGASGTGKTLISYHAIASHLLAHESGEVAVIDTTGAFSPLQLRDVLAFRIEARLERAKYHQHGYVYEKIPSNHAKTGEDDTEDAASMLDRVKVMRVFDLTGVVEAVSEIRSIMERYSVHVAIDEIAVADGNKAEIEIRDSEEGCDENGDGSPSAKPVHNPSTKSIGMIVVDTITNVVSSVVQRSQTQGQAVLASFMRSFHHLTVQHHICTILINATVGINKSNNPEYQRRQEEQVSVFSSTSGKPALGKTFAYLIDTSIFLSIIPKSDKDAVLALSDIHGSSVFQKSFILEVLKDRNGTREERWAAFDIVTGVKLVPLDG